MTRLLGTLRKAWLVFLAAGAIVAIVLILRRDVSAFVWPQLISVRNLVFVCLAQLVFWWIAATMWTRLSRIVAGNVVSTWHGFQQLALVGLGKYLPGKIWGIVARGSHMAAQGVSTQRIAVATFYEQCISLHGAALMCAVAYAIQNPTGLFLTVAAAAILSMFAGAWWSSLAVRAGGWLALRAGLGFSEDDIEPVSSRQYFWLVLGYAFLWTFLGAVFLGLYCAFFSDVVDVRIGLGLIMANAVAITAGFFALFAPGGIGVREAVGASLLVAYIPLPEAAALVILFRIWATAMDGIAGIAVIPALRRSKTT